MQTFEKLFNLAGEIDTSWEERESVDWSEAEQLVALCKDIPVDVRSTLTEINHILDYVYKVDDWDSGYVSHWPELIQHELTTSDKTYTYRAKDDEWEVYGVFLSGEEDWAGTVSTEKVAQVLVEAMSR